MNTFNLTPQQVSNFWNRINKTESCWLWAGNTVSTGYGRMHIGNQVTARAHRVAWFLANGTIPDGMNICHKCDVRTCCNPDHLFLGSHTDNIRDRSEKLRDNHGENVNTCKLTTQQVLEIRYRWTITKKRRGFMTRIGKMYGVSHTLIGLIVSGKSWRHLLPKVDHS